MWINYTADSPDDKAGDRETAQQSQLHEHSCPGLFSPCYFLSLFPFHVNPMQRGPGLAEGVTNNAHLLVGRRPLKLHVLMSPHYKIPDNGRTSGPTTRSVFYVGHSDFYVIPLSTDKVTYRQTDNASRILILSHSGCPTLIILRVATDHFPAPPSLPRRRSLWIYGIPNRTTHRTFTWFCMEK